MPDAKKKKSARAGAGVEAEPSSRVRIKEQPLDREALARIMAASLQEQSRDALDALIAEAQEIECSREELAQRVIALGLEYLGDRLSVEERAELALQVLDVVLNDPRFE